MSSPKITGILQQGPARSGTSDMLKLAVLVPVTSRTSQVSTTALQGTNNPKQDANERESPLKTVCDGLSKLAASLSGSKIASDRTSTVVLLGIDSDDETLLMHQQQLVEVFRAADASAVVVVLAESDRPCGDPPGALCRIWGLMAKMAVEKYGCNLAVLLGDDTEVSPHSWPDLVKTSFAEKPDVMLLLLNDASDPGFPSFPVLRIDRHLHTFERLLPRCFINQGGDPYLAALYRRFTGCVAMLPDVTVINHVGGVQRSEQPYAPPRYDRCSVSKEEVLQQLDISTAILQNVRDGSCKQHQHGRPAADVDTTCNPDNGLHQAVMQDKAASDVIEKATGVPACTKVAHSSSNGGCGDGRFCCQLSIDVLVPSARLDVTLLEGIANAVLGSEAPASADLSLVIIVDKAPEHISQHQSEWLQLLQTKWLHKVRVRINKQNMGASAARNQALQESLADYVIFWDDDIVPTPGCLAAYVEAMLKHPKALGFAGPSYIPRNPNSLWTCAVHLADVLFFWDAAANWQVAPMLPWAVTANLAVRNTAHQFDLRFPKTGGGEDIDYCLKVTGGKMIPVPKAAVHHPLWNDGQRCYSRFFGWAYGDGALIAMYPELCCYSWPCSAEACCILLLLAVAATSLACMLFSASLLLRLWLTLQSFRAPALANTAAGMTAPAHVSAFMLQYCSWLWQYSLGFLQAAVGFKAADMVLDVVRSFHPVRMRKHPANSIVLRTAAAIEASMIKTWSETGRLWGLVRRSELQSSLFRRFDWFCGLSAAVVAAEKQRAAWRFMACCVCAVWSYVMVPQWQAAASGRLYWWTIAATAVSVMWCCAAELCKLEG